MRECWAAWRTPKPYGELGDPMVFSERATWAVMRVYRRWTVFFLLQALTVVWWTHPSWFPGGLAGWNYVWSDLAIVVEMMVGIAFLNQMWRDGKIMRRSLGELSEVLGDVREMVADTHRSARLLHCLADKLGVEGDEDG